MVIGGAAAAIAYDAGTRTADIDLWRGVSDELLTAAARARQETGLAVAIGSAADGHLPLDYQDRLRPARGLTLRNLALSFPDKSVASRRR